LKNCSRRRSERARGLELIEFQMNERGYALMNQKKFPEAIESYRKSLTLDPGNDNAKAMLETLTKK
jgi:tetratricopeptide (TPR) repeat protein